MNASTWAMRDPETPVPVAIVGLGCRFPGGADTPQRFWRLLRDGVDAITEVPPDRFDLESVYDADRARPGKLYARWGGFVDRVDGFDAGFFGISPREARRMDPQHRLLLEAVWSSLEDGGQVPERLAGTRTGVFVGISSHDYGDVHVLPARRHLLDAYATMANAAFTAANRISYLLDLHGPSLAVDSACSSSLTAVHLACQHLASRECEVAIAAGVNLCLTPEPIIGLCRAGMLSPDGRSRAFDSRANGYVRGEGAGAVVLKPLARALEDGDPIHAVILASVINQDGRTPALSIPNPDAQAEMLRRTLVAAGVAPAEVQYVEAHGTGTPVGDPLEAGAIGRVFGAGRADGEACLLGSVKTNIGHLEAGAGIAGLIKTTLALEHRQIPPSLHFVEANPQIPLEELHLRVPTRLEPWPAPPGKGRAGVSSFGFGGSNAHVLLAEAPLPDGASPGETGTRAYLLPLSARTPAALRELAGRYADLLGDEDAPALADLCYTAAVRRSHHEHRLALVGSSVAELRERLDAFLRDEQPAGAPEGQATRQRGPKLAFVYSGMGPQWWGMGRQLLEQEPVFRDALTECDRILRPLGGWSLLQELTASEERSRVHDADLAHVSNLAMQIGLTELWRSWGVVPDAVVGHSSGEMAATYAAGALSLEEVLHLAYHRGRLQHRLSGSGRMLAVGLSAHAAAELIAPFTESVSLAAINSPGSITLSGGAEALERVAVELERRQVFQRFLKVDVPYHGPQMEALREELFDCLRELRPGTAGIPLVSSVTGARVDGAELGADHWWRNLREPVRFAEAVDRLLEEGCEHFVEVGPHPVASAALIECVAHRRAQALVLPTLRRQEDERATMLRALAALYAHGRCPDWRGLYPTGACVRLPTYPWQRERHWYEEVAEGIAHGSVGVDTGHPLLGRRLRSPRAVWEAELGDARLAYLDEHRVQESVVFPAAGYVELALAAARQLWGEAPAAADGIEFRRLLFLNPRARCLLQVHHHPERGTVEVHAAAAADGQSWTLHATSALTPLGARGAAETVDLGAIRTSCAEPGDPAALYLAFERLGLRYGPAFRGLRELWLGDGQALGRVALEGSDEDTRGYRVHPALLDAAFQVLGAAATTEDGAPRTEGPLVPTHLSRVELIRSPGRECWAHAVLTRREGDALVGELRLLDDRGDLLLRCEGLRLQPLAGTASGGAEHGFYEMHWEEVPLRPTLAADGRTLPAPSALAAETRGLVQPRHEANPLHAYYETVEPALHRIAMHHVRTALRTLGWRPAMEGAEPAALAEKLGVIPRHGRFFARLLEIHRLEPHSPRRGDERTRVAGFAPGRLAHRVLADNPGHGAEFELLDRCGRSLAGVLRGETDPRELLFGDSLEALSRLYRSSPVSRYYLDLAATAVEAAARHRPEGPPLRILEVGAGTGGLTAAVLPRLRPGTVDYLFTDLSGYFLARAREEFRDRPDLRFGLLDIEVAPEEQTTPPASFDLVLAANVLHATADARRSLVHLRRLLAPGGLLVLLEVARRMPWFELIFGLLEGWWRFADHDLRPDHPLLRADEWHRPLVEAGFEDVAALADPPREGGPMQSVILAGAPPAGRPASDVRARRWVLFADEHGVGARVAAALRARGDACTLVRPGTEFVRRSAGEFEISPTLAGDTDRLLDALLAEGGALDGVVHLWSLDIPPVDGRAAPEVMDAQRLGCGSVLHLIQALERAGATPGVWLVTAGSQVIGGEPVSGLAQAPLWGLGRVLRSEQPTLRTRLVDVGPECSDQEIAGLVEELLADEVTGEIALRGRSRRVRRLRRAVLSSAGQEPATLRVSPTTSALHLEVGTPGALDTLRLREAPLGAPGPGQVSVRVVAAGLNFRDVLLALGMLPPSVGGVDAGTLSLECAGIVVACGEGVVGFRPGDEVVALAIGAIGSHAIARAELVVHRPPHLSVEEGAGVAGAYLTAHYGLNHLARMEAGERVLIHSASGGVGHAAVRLCQHAGAEIFATAGTPEKREYLRSLGIEHVMDSRSLAWVDEVRERTGGEGVDVVLNSLAGEALARGLQVLRPFGRFVEIGKRDVYQDAPLGLLPFRKNLAFFGVDLVRLCDERPGFAGAMLRELMARLAVGELAPPPLTAFDVSAAEQAFRQMAQARHIGKIVLTLRQSEYLVRPAEDRPLFRPDGTYLVTGGLGGFGLAVAEWMVQQGARHLVLMSRSGVPKDNEEALRSLRRSEAEVRVVRADVAREEDVARVLHSIRAGMPPLRGVLHLAMVLDDAMLGQLDQERFRTVLEPKVAGSWNLHRMTAKDPLDHFVLFSSIASVIGHPLQGNYAAANAFLDSLAAYRHGLGLPAATVGWGTVAEVGYVSRHPELPQHLARLGIESLSPAEALAALEQVMRRGRPHLVAARLALSVLQRWNGTPGDTEREGAAVAADDEGSPGGGPEDLLPRLRRAAPGERAAMLEAYLIPRVAKVLGSTPGRVDAGRPLPELGLDSLLAVELLTVLRLDLGVQLPVVKLLQGTSTRELSGLVLGELALDAAPAPARPTDGEAVPPAEAPGSVAPVEEIRSQLPLSFEQRGLWFLDRWSGGNPAYHLYAAARLNGRLDAARLERALHEVVHRHDALRARFPVADEQPVQVMEPEVPMRLARVDLREVAAEERESQLQELARAEIRRPFDLDRAPLLRSTLFRLSEEEHVVLLTVHHLVADAFSMTLLVKEVMASYGAPVHSRPEPRVGYADYVRWQRETLSERLLAEQLAYWTERLTGAPPALELPADRPRPAVQSFRGGHLAFELPEALSEGLRELSRREGVTLFMTLLAAFQALLHRYSSAEDLCIGTPVATRNLPGGEALIGCCMNTLVLRTDLSGDPGCGELLRRVREATLGAVAHQEVPFERVVEALRPTRDPGRSPLFQAMLVLHNLRWPELRMEGLAVRPQEVESGTSMHDLTLLVDAGECLHGTLEYNADLFDAATASRLLRSFVVVLEAIVAQPGRRLSSLPLLRPGEHGVEVEWNDTAIDFGEPRCLHQLVAAQAHRTPDALALASGSGGLTYRELDRRADRLAQRLRALGVGPEVLVGLQVEPSTQAAVGALGILKAGGAFLPLDPHDPRERLDFMLRDAQVRVLVTTPGLLDRVPAGAEVVVLDADAPSDADAGADPPQDLATPGSLAYLIYTSGSTGAPKGVMVEHRAIWNQLMWRQTAFPLAGTDAVLQRTPLGFDPSVWELFGPLAAGARLVLPPSRDLTTDQLVRIVADEGVTVLQVVPSLLAALLEEPALAVCHSLRRVFCGGEPLTSRLQERFFDRLPSVELINLYGPTEASIDASWWRCRPGDGLPSVPIGRPIANARVHVVDARLQPVPIGVPGELCIGGAGVARGYLNRPELTAERFVPDPLGDRAGGRVYRTGDRARVRPDGSLEFLGRLDEQLKIRGVRIEPGEVEAALVRHPSVREAAVVAVGETPEERRLVAYATVDAGQVESGEALRRFLAGALPAVLLPARVVLLEALPRLPSGKLDRKRLSETDHLPVERPPTIVAPRDTTELRLVRLWEDFFARPVGVTDDFFDLGGNSLSAARMVGRLRREFGRELPLSILFRAPTVEAISRALRHSAGPARPSPLVPLQPHGSRPPFFCVHPTGGDVFCYQELARLLDDQPFFGLQAPGLDDEEEPHARIEALAEHYLNAVRDRQPEGPYVLGGWSMGGLVAFEMARLLDAQGERVGLLAVLDAPPVNPDGGAGPAVADTPLRGFAIGLDLDGRQLSIPDDPGSLGEEQVQTLLERVHGADGVLDGLELPQLRRYLRVFKAHTEAMRAYLPRPYPGTVTLFAARERAGDASDDPVPAWERCALGGVVVHGTPGNHYTMLRQPNVRSLAALLATCIAEACVLQPGPPGETRRTLPLPPP